MKIILSASERDALLVHFGFVIACLIIILIPLGIAIGIKLFTLIIIYNLLIVIVSIWRNYKNWLYI